MEIAIFVLYNFYLQLNVLICKLYSFLDIKNTMRKIFIILALYVVPFFSLGQKLPVRFEGVVNNQDLAKKEAGVTIEIKQGGKTIVSASTASNGTYVLKGEVERSQPFEVYYRKQGMVSKKISFDFKNLNVEDTPPGDFSPIKTLDMDLFSDRPGIDFGFLNSEPVAKFEIKPGGISLAFDQQASANVKKKVDDLLKKAADKAKTDAANFQRIVGEANKLYDTKNYDAALAKYEEASNIDPKDKHVINRINEIYDLVHAKKEAALADKQKNQEYNNLIQAGDALYKQGDLEKAKARYKEASEANAEEDYPLDQIKKINADIKKKENELKYKQMIEAADIMMKQKSYKSARDNYDTASKLSPAEQYPKDQIKKIDELLKAEEEISNKKKAYEDALAAADAFYSSEKWNEALTKYSEAIGLESASSYAIGRKKDVEGKIAAIANEKKKQDDIAKLLKEGDALVTKNTYADALVKFKEALLLDDKNQATKDKIENVNKLILDEKSAKDILVKYDATIKEADLLRDQKKHKEAIEKYTIAQGLLDKPYPTEQIKKINEAIDKAAADKAEQERLAKEAADKAAADKAEQERLAKEAADKAAADKAEQERLAKEAAAKAAADKAEQERLAKEAADKAAADKAEQERLAKEAADKAAADKAEQERLAKEAGDKAAADKAEQERLAKEAGDKAAADKAEQERLAKEAADKAAADKAEQERLAKEAADKAAADKAEQERLAKAAADKAAADKAEQERLAKEAGDKAAADKAEQERLAKAAADKAAADKAEQERLAKEAADKVAAEKAEQERLAKEAGDKAAADKAEQERLAKAAADKAAADKAEQERLAKEAADKVAAEKAELERLARIADEQKKATKSTVDIEYENFLLKGDELVEKQEYAAAIEAYNKALDLKPEQQLPVAKAKKAQELANHNQNEANQAFEKLITAIENKIEEEDFVKARDYINRAKNIRSNDPRPNALLLQIENIEKENQLYAKLMAEAEGKAQNQLYNEAIVLFNQAKTVKVKKIEPQQRIDEINQLLKDKEKNQSNDAQFNAFMLSAKTAEDAKDYDAALSFLRKAEVVRRDDSKVKTKIIEIENKINQRQENLQNQKIAEEHFNQVMKTADDAMSNKEYQKAVSYYGEARQLQGQNKTVKLKYDEAVRLNLLESEKAMEEQYKKIIALADNYFNTKNFPKAIEYYKRASALKKNNDYPKRKLEEINHILNPPVVNSGELGSLGDPFDPSILDGEVALKQADAKRKDMKMQKTIKLRNEVDASTSEAERIKRNSQQEMFNTVYAFYADVMKGEINEKDKKAIDLEILRQKEIQLADRNKAEHEFKGNENIRVQDYLTQEQSKLSLEFEGYNSEKQSELEEVKRIRMEVENKDVVDKNTLKQTNINNKAKVDDIGRKIDVRQIEDIDAKREGHVFVSDKTNTISDKWNQDADQKKGSNLSSKEHLLEIEKSKAGKETKAQGELIQNEGLITDIHIKNEQYNQSQKASENQKYLEQKESIEQIERSKLNQVNEAEQGLKDKNLQVKLVAKNVQNAIDSQEASDQQERMNAQTNIDNKKYESSISTTNNVDKQRSSQNSLTDLSKDLSLSQSSLTKEKSNEGYAIKQQIDNMHTSKSETVIVKNTLGEKYPEGVSQEMFQRKDADGLPIAIITRRVVVIEGKGVEYIKTQSLNAITYTKSGTAITEYVWQKETNNASLKRHF